MCLQTELSTELYEAKNLIFNLLNRTLGNSNLNDYDVEVARHLFTYQYN